MKVETSVYLVLEPERDWAGKVEAIKVDRMTLRPPDLKSRHVALKVNISIDAGIFEQFIPEASISIMDGRVLVTPDVSVAEPESTDEVDAEPETE